MTSPSGAAASAWTVGNLAQNFAKYGMTTATVVCCSMISLSQTRYGSATSPGSARQGSARRCRSYHSSSDAIGEGRADTMSDMKDQADGGNPASPRPDPQRPDTSRPDTSRHIYGPRPVSALLPTLTRPVFRKRGAAAAQLIADWEAIVGPKLAQTTAPRKLAAGTLAIACSGPVALELQHLSAALIARINTHSGHSLVQRLRFVQEAMPPPKPAAPAPASRDPRHRRPGSGRGRRPAARRAA